MADNAIPDSLVDLAYDAMCAELNNWQIVGPLEDRRASPLPPREFWNAVRTENVAISTEPDPTIFHLDTRANAIACVQWHGLRAAIAAVRGELAPTASNESSNDNG